MTLYYVCFFCLVNCCSSKTLLCVTCLLLFFNDTVLSVILKGQAACVYVWSLVREWFIAVVTLVAGFNSHIQPCHSHGIGWERFGR